jgi:hypothetical protein
MIISGKNRFLTAQCLAVGVALVGFALYAPRMLAQAVAEAAATTSATAGVAANAKPTESFKPISAAATQGPAPSAQVSLHILSSTKTVSVDANRRALESRAGAADGACHAFPSTGVDKQRARGQHATASHTGAGKIRRRRRDARITSRDCAAGRRVVAEGEP